MKLYQPTPKSIIVRRKAVKVSHNVNVWVRDVRTGRVTKWRTHNDVCDIDYFRDIIWGTAYRPDRIAVGTGTTSLGQGATALGSEVYEQAIDRRNGPSQGSVALTTLIGTADANGNTLGEEGLKEVDRLISQALISPAIVKTAAIEVTITHTITFTEAP